MKKTNKQTDKQTNQLPNGKYNKLTIMRMSETEGAAALACNSELKN